MGRKFSPNLVQQTEKIFAVVNGRLVSTINGKIDSEEIPKIGKRIILSTHRRLYKSMCVGDHGRIADNVEPFDTLYYEWGDRLVILQIMPTNDPRYGVIKYLGTQPLEINILGEHHLHSNYDNHRHRQEGN